MKYRFFFDYMSTGFWGENPGDCGEDVPDYIPEHLKLAITLWLALYESLPSYDKPTDEWLKWYNEQGEYIVSELNKLGKDEFVYVHTHPVYFYSWSVVPRM